MAQSQFAFNFRLTPWENCLNLNFHGVQLAPRFGAVCTRDFLGIFWNGKQEDYQQAVGTAHHLARSLVHAHAFCSFPNGCVLDVEPVTWLELRNSQPEKIVSGYMHPTLNIVPLVPDHSDSAPLRRAASMVHQILQFFQLGLALADFHAARRETGSYGFFYAYRVLEDVGYHFGATKGDHPDWDAMNKALKTSKQKWDPLIKAGTSARHLSQEKLKQLVQADPGRLLALAHEAITLFIEHLRITP
jgi:hypothetical protein